MTRPYRTPTNEVTVVTSVRLPERLVKVVDRRAKREKLSRNAMIIEIIEDWKRTTV